MSFNFENLPERVVNLIFSYLTYSNLTKLRAISSWFRAASSSNLNRTFLRVKQDLENEMCLVLNEVNRREIDNNENEEDEEEKILDNDLDHISNMQLRYKVLQILNSEISILYAVCERYIKFDAYNFTGGMILDYFYEIMNKNFNLTDAKNPLESHATMQLFLLNEEFMDYFEESIEPDILAKNFNPWFGVKIADILDLYANSNYHIQADYREDRLQLSARYEVLNPETVTEVNFSESNENTGKLMKISRYIRNQVRWQNFFYYIDAPYESIKSIVNKRDRRYNKFCLNPAELIDDGSSVYNNEEIAVDKFKKTFSRRLGNPCSKENVSYGIELRCNKNSVPHRLEPHVVSVTQNDYLLDDINADSCNFLTITDEASSIYDFILTVKIVLPSEDKSYATENYLEIYQNNQIVKISQSNKEIPI